MVTNTEQMTFDTVSKVVQLCEDKKAEDIMVYDLRGKAILIDYCVLCTANNDAQIRAILHHVDKELKKLEILPKNIEGKPASGWIIMDYYDFLIHIFREETRSLYRIEELLEIGHSIHPGDVEETVSG